MLISSGKAKPSAIVSHELSLDEVLNAHKHFNARDKGWTKVVLKPVKTSSGKKQGVR